MVNLRSIKDFIVILNEILATKNESQIKSPLEIREILLKALGDFIFITSKEEKNTITEGIYKKFEESKDIENIKINKILYSLFSNKSKNLKYLYFQKWKKMNLLSSNSSNTKTKSYIGMNKRKLSKTE